MVSHDVDGALSVTGPSKGKPGRHYTEIARAALAETRRRAKEEPKVKPTLEVFVTRVSGGNAYRWEIRQFGGVVFERGQGSFATLAEAQADGERALADRLATSSDARLP